jgi:hypothetical protein
MLLFASRRRSISNGFRDIRVKPVSQPLNKRLAL